MRKRTPLVRIVRREGQEGMVSLGQKRAEVKVVILFTVNNLFKYYQAAMFKVTKTNGKLLPLLEKPGLTPQELFNVPDILGDLKQKIQTFLAFCLKRRDFTTRMLTITLNTQYQSLQDPAQQKLAQLASDVLSSDENAVSDFLFNHLSSLGNEPAEMGNLEEGGAATIESEAERLFCDEGETTNSNGMAWMQEENVFEKYELIKLTLAHLSAEQKNQTCLGYINKIYASILRKEGGEFLDFLQQNPGYVQLLINNLQHSSIAHLFSLILSCEDKEREYKHEPFKKQLFANLLESAYSNIGSNLVYEGFISAVEEIFNSTKQSYYQYFEDFKRCANVLVEEETLLKFADFLNSKEETIFTNAVAYLEIVFKRINSEDDDQDYYRQSQPTEPTMKFEHNCLLLRFESLVDLIPVSSSYNSICRLSFLNFLIQLLKNIKDKPVGLDNLAILKKIITFFFREASHGMIKNYLFQMIKICLKHVGPSEMEALAEWLIQNGYQKVLNNDMDRVDANLNQVSCFSYALCFQIQENNENFLPKLKETGGLVMDETFGRYQTKLANYGKKSEPNSNKDDDFQLTFDIPVRKGKKEESPEESKNQVGKNHIVIPTLHLPIKNEGKKITFDQEEVEQLIIPEQNSRQMLIQDLKNTKIELPAKFRQKKSDPEVVQEKQKEKPNVETANGLQIIRNGDDKVKNEVQKTGERCEQKGGWEGAGKREGGKEGGVQFFVKHLLIF